MNNLETSGGIRLTDEDVALLWKFVLLGANEDAFNKLNEEEQQKYREIMTEAGPYIKRCLKQTQSDAYLMFYRSVAMDLFRKRGIREWDPFKEDLMDFVDRKAFYALLADVLKNPSDKESE